VRRGRDEDDNDDDGSSDEEFERMLKFDGNAGGFRLDFAIPKTTADDDIDRSMGDDREVDDVYGFSAQE
jgi:hypothetical protein